MEGRKTSGRMPRGKKELLGKGTVISGHGGHSEEVTIELRQEV